MEERLIQPIVLLIDKSNRPDHLDAINVVARASVMAYSGDLLDDNVDAWKPWLATSFGKTVRRADLKAFTKVTSRDDGEFVSSKSASAVAFAPMHYADMPKELSRLQVSGTDLPRGEALAVEPTQIVLNASLGMTTGKAAAQAAHALFGWFLTLGETEQQHQLLTGLQSSVIEVPAEEFNELSQRSAAPVIVDSGFTEIAPRSATAFILRSQP